MRRLSVALVGLFMVLASACQTDEAPPSPEPTPKLEVTAEEVSDAVLDSSDVGESWSKEGDPPPSTVQMGGRVGPANVRDAEAEAIAAFTKEGTTGYVTSSVFLVDSPEVSQAVMLAHRQAESETTWVQERKDGGDSRFKRVGPVGDLAGLGDEAFSARLSVTVTDPGGDKTKRKINYVVFHIDRLLAFVIAQDAKVEEFARRQEQKLARLTA